MMHREELDHLALLGGEPQTFAHDLRELPTAVDVRGTSGTCVFTQIVQKQGEFQERLVWGLLIEARQGLETRLVRLGKPLKHLDATQGVLIDCVAMIQIVLDQTSEGIEFGDISAEQTMAMHLTQDRSRMRLRQDTEEQGGGFWTTPDGFISEQGRLGF